MHQPSIIMSCLHIDCLHRWERGGDFWLSVAAPFLALGSHLVSLLAAPLHSSAATARVLARTATPSYFCKPRHRIGITMMNIWASSLFTVSCFSSLSWR